MAVVRSRTRSTTFRSIANAGELGPSLMKLMMAVNDLGIANHGLRQWKESPPAGHRGRIVPQRRWSLRRLRRRSKLRRRAASGGRLPPPPREDCSPKRVLMAPPGRSLTWGRPTGSRHFRPTIVWCGPGFESCRDRNTITPAIGCRSSKMRWIRRTRHTSTRSLAAPCSRPNSASCRSWIRSA